MLVELGLAEAELSVLLTTDLAIKELNRTYRRKNRPTDVLAFPMDEVPSGPTPRLLGDVVISLETAALQAQNAGHSLALEATELLAHGLLHLLGYDHANQAEMESMRNMTARLVATASRRGRVAGEGRALQGNRATRVAGKRSKARV
jgi:probable rRNA maturation factor